MSIAFESWTKQRFEELFERLEKLEAVVYQMKESKKDSTDDWLKKRFKKKEE